MSSKAARRKRKRIQGSSRSMFAAQRQYDHAASARPAEEDVRKVVEDARRRHLAAKPDADMADAMMGCEVGRAIRLTYPKDAEADPLWRAWCAMDMAAEIYHNLVMGKSRFPATTKMECLPDRIEVRHDIRPDLRTEEERVASAKRAWGDWCSRMGTLPPPEHAALHMALWRRVKLHDKDRLTGAGRMAVIALRKMAA